MKLSLRRSTIRSWRLEDIDSLVRHADDQRVSRNLRDRFPHPYTRRDAQAWLQLVPGLTPETHFALEVDGAAVGGIGLELMTDVHRRTGELGFWLGFAYWGRGIVSEAAAAFTEWAFQTCEVARIESLVFASNSASARVLEKCGFQLEGCLRQSITKNGETGDALLYARVRVETGS